MKRIRNLTIATVFGFGLGLTSLTGTANAAATVQNGTSSPVAASQSCLFYQWLPYLYNGKANGNASQPAQQTQSLQPQQNQAKYYPPMQSPWRFYQIPQQQTPAQNSNQAKPQQSSNNSQQVPAQSANQQASSFAQQVVNLVNQERAKAGLAPLQADAGLTKVAMAKATDMAQNNYFSHTSPTYGSPFDMMKQFGVSYRTAGENIAMGQRSPQEVMTQWMNSQGHRQNILNPSFTRIGVGYVNGYWVQEFAG